MSCGEGIAPALGAVLYDVTDLRYIIFTQPAAYVVALAALFLLMCWWGLSSRRKLHQRHAQQQQQQQQHASEELRLCTLQPFSPKEIAGGNAKKAEAPHLLIRAFSYYSNSSDAGEEGEAYGGISRSSSFSNSYCSTAPSDDLAANSEDDQQVSHDAVIALGRCTGSGDVWAPHGLNPVFHLALRNILLRTDSARELSQCDVASTISKASMYSTPHADDFDDVEQQRRTQQDPQDFQALQHVQMQERPEPVMALNMLGCSFVLCEGLQVVLTQALRAAVDVMLPLAMYTTPTYVLGIVFLSGLAGSVVGPLLLDCLLERFPGLSTRTALTCSMLCMAAAAPVVLGLNNYSIFVAVGLFAIGAFQACSEALAFKHLVDYTRCSTLASLCNSMYVYTVFLSAGFTMGSFAAGLPEHGKLLQMQVAAGAIALGCAVYTLAYGLVLKLGYVKGGYELLA